MIPFNDEVAIFAHPPEQNAWKRPQTEPPANHPGWWPPIEGLRGLDTTTTAAIADFDEHTGWSPTSEFLDR